MKKLIFILIVISSKGFSQLTYSWVKGLTYSSVTDYLIRGVEVGNSGNVYIVGKLTATTDFDPSSANFFLSPNIYQSCFLAKYTSSGNFIWAKEIISETVMHGSPDVNDIVIDSNENIYITGSYWETVDFDPSSSTYTLCANTTYTNSGGGTAYNRFAYTAKYNSSGNFIWAKDIRRSYYPFSFGSGSQGGGVKIALDGSDNIYVGAICGNRPYFCKYNNTGIRLWQDSLVTSLVSGHEGFLTGLYVNSVGEVFVGGTFTNDIDMDPSVGSSSLNAGWANFLGKYSTNGAFIWGKKLNKSMNFEAALLDITSDANGNVYACGVGSIAGAYKSQITKWDNSGNLQWFNYFHDNVSILSGGCSDIYISCNNNILVTGYLQGSSIVSDNNFDPLGGTYTCSPLPSSLGSVYIASYSSLDCAILWAKTIGGDVRTQGGIDIEGNLLNSPPLLSNSFIDNNGSVYLYGASLGAAMNDFDPDSAIVNLNPNTDKAFFAKYTGCGLVGINEVTELQNHISVFPNPSTGQFIFSGLVGENKIEVVDITGRGLLTEKTFAESYTLNLNASQGIYFYKITDKQNRVQQGKLILN